MPRPAVVVVVVATECRFTCCVSHELHPRATDPDLISNFLNISIYLLHVVKLMFIEYFCNRISVFYYAYEFFTVVTITQMTWRGRRRIRWPGVIASWSILFGTYSLPSAWSAPSKGTFSYTCGLNEGFDETVRRYFL